MAEEFKYCGRTFESRLRMLGRESRITGGSSKSVKVVELFLYGNCAAGMHISFTTDSYHCQCAQNTELFEKTRQLQQE